MSVPLSAADVLGEHVVFELESIDRMYCNAYVAKLTYSGESPDVDDDGLLLRSVYRYAACSTPLGSLRSASALDITRLVG